MVAVGRKAHQLVFTTVDFEATVIGKSRIEQTERVGKGELPEHFDLAAPSFPDGGGRPLANTINSQNCRLFERGRIKGTGRV